jgi:hypothetical protein
MMSKMNDAQIQRRRKNRCRNEETATMIHLRSPFGSHTVAQGYADSASHTKKGRRDNIGLRPGSRGCGGGKYDDGVSPLPQGSFEEVVKGWHPTEKAGCLICILDDIPRTFRDDTNAKKIYLLLLVSRWEGVGRLL